MKRNLVVQSLASLSLTFFHPQIAAGETAASSAAAALATTTISQAGERVVLSDVGGALTPPAGWEVRLGQAGMTLQALGPEPVLKKDDFASPIYRPTLTLAVLHHPAPMDQVRAAELMASLEKNFGKDPTVQDFQIVDHKFIDHRGKGDALIVFTRMKLKSFDMMQVHLLVSGSSKQFLVTYTDLASVITGAGPEYEKVWNSMMSVEIEGMGPKRYEDVLQLGIVALVLSLVLGLVAFLRSRRARSLYESAGDEIYQDEGAENNTDLDSRHSGIVSSMGWHLGTKAPQGGSQAASTLKWKTGSSGMSRTGLGATVSSISEHRAVRAKAPASKVSRPVSTDEWSGFTKF